MSEYNNIESLSETELMDLIYRATKTLDQRQKNQRRDGITKIKQIAEAIGIQVEIVIPGEQKKHASKNTKPVVKYRDPNNQQNTWTGRGQIPRWLNAYINQGKSIENFKL